VGLVAPKRSAFSNNLEDPKFENLYKGEERYFWIYLVK